MRLHNCDASGDWLPCRGLNENVSGPEAVRRLIDHRMNLLAGDWWENPAHGCPMLQLLQERLSEANVHAATYALATYLAETNGVLSLEKVRGAVQDRRYTFTADVLTREGSFSVSYAYDL